MFSLFRFYSVAKVSGSRWTLLYYFELAESEWRFSLSLSLSLSGEGGVLPNKMIYTPFTAPGDSLILFFLSCTTRSVGPMDGYLIWFLRRILASIQVDG